MSHFRCGRGKQLRVKRYTYYIVVLVAENYGWPESGVAMQLIQNSAHLDQASFVAKMMEWS